LNLDEKNIPYIINIKRKTKLEKYGDENFNNADVAQKRKTMEERGLWVSESKMSDWELYRYNVRRLNIKTSVKYIKKLS